MKRYSIESVSAFLIEDDNGEWVRYKDVKEFIEPKRTCLGCVHIHNDNFATSPCVSCIGLE